jgi:hypothetical protein
MPLDSTIGLLGTMMGTAVATFILLLALFYMAAQFFRKPEYEAFVSIELYQLAVSLILFASIFLSACFSERIIESFVGGGQDAFAVAGSYLQYISHDISLASVEKLQALALLAQWASSVTLRFGASVWGVTIPAFPSLVVIERTVEFIIMVVSPFTASLMVQQIGLQVIYGTMIPFVLPMGTVLRMFPPTRDAGAFLMSTSLAFGLIFPFTYVMHSAIVRGILIPAAYNDTDQYRAAMDRYNAGTVADYITDHGLFNPWNMFWRPMVGISFLLLQSIFLPALSISLAVAFIKSFNKFISRFG